MYPSKSSDSKPHLLLLSLIFIVCFAIMLFLYPGVLPPLQEITHIHHIDHSVGWTMGRLDKKVKLGLLAEVGGAGGLGGSKGPTLLSGIFLLL